MKLLSSPLLLPLLLAAACAGQTAPETGDPDRAPLGKADNIGTCEGACDGPALLGNCWCDDLCEAYGDCCEDKVEICDAPPSTFDSFETFRGGFCPPDIDCTSTIALDSAGLLKVDLMGDPNGGIYEAQVDDSDLAHAISVLTSDDLLVILDGQNPACPAPTDVFESMTLHDGNGEHRTSVTFCDDPAIQAAREVLSDLKDKYIQTSDFESFRVFRGGFCPPAVDCSSSIELLADGTLNVDRMNDLQGGIHTATVTDIDLRDTIKVLTDPALIEILDADEPPCVAPTDVFESMNLKDSAGEHRVGVTFCHGPEIDAVRDALDSLVSKYL